MIQRNVFIAMMVCLSALSSPLIALGQTGPAITIITSEQRPVDLGGADPVTVNYLNLDDVGTLEKRLSRDLPLDEAQAEIIVKQRIARIGQAALNAQLVSAYRGVISAMQFGIDRYPAIIFENRFVIYGVTDVAFALRKYNAWRQKEIN